MLFETPSATCAVLHRCDLAQITILFLRHDSALFVPFAKPQRCTALPQMFTGAGRGKERERERETLHYESYNETVVLYRIQG